MRFHLFASTAIAGVSVLLLGGCQIMYDSVSGAVHRLSPKQKSSGATKPAQAAGKSKEVKGLAVALRLEPFPAKVSEARRVEVVVHLKNVSKRFAQLQFPTSQRFDIVVRNEFGKTVAQWSEDQTFDVEPTMVGINPGEQVEFRGFFSTRDLQPGRPYTVAVVFPNRADLTTEMAFVPEK